MRLVLEAIEAARFPVAPRFWSKVERRGPSDCWPWTGACDSKGYGGMQIGGRFFVVSRVAYALNFGVEPDKLVCHSCDNPPCCNPAHLWLGTHADNVHDMIAKGRNRHWNDGRSWASPIAKLTAGQVLEIKKGGATSRQFAERFGVARSTIGQIRCGKNWAWLKPTPPATSDEAEAA